jgi:hypothetical protein
MPSPDLKKARRPNMKILKAMTVSHRFQLRRKRGTRRRHAINNRSKIASHTRMRPAPKARSRLSHAVSSPETKGERKYNSSATAATKRRKSHSGGQERKRLRSEGSLSGSR